MLPRAVRTLLVAVAFAVCVSPVRTQPLYNATVIEQLGQVSTQDSGYLTPLYVGSSIAPQKLIVTGPDGYAKFKVSDGSTFEVFNNSRVMFRENLGTWKDLLNVWIGRVKVFIQHEPGKANPNDVSTPTAVISVRGTVFDVVVEDSDGTTVVSVDEGTVWVRNTTAPGDRKVVNQGDDPVRVFRGIPLLAKVDKNGAYRIVLRKVEEAVYQVLLNRRMGGGSVPAGGVPGVNADKGKGGSTSGSPGTAPPPPATAPPPPGGGGGGN